MRNPWALVLLLNLVLLHNATAQDNPTFTDKILGLPAKFNDRIQKKADKLEVQVTRQTEKYLQRLARKEEKLRCNMGKTDSTAAKHLVGCSAEKYEKLAEKLKNSTAIADRAGGQYLPYVDSLKTSLSFLEKNKDLLNSQETKKITGSLQQVQQLQGKLQQTEEITAFIHQHKVHIKVMLSRNTNLSVGHSKGYPDIQRDIYYYFKNVQAYKDLLNNPDELLFKSLGCRV
ncbi:hypothetical protein [Paraflavitalea sp. CAU 1676]|uniref:hypothetical protein n=1 Tax=Paraflavitalea sp. CAU 1676 TaxID=3032598 RepID=UPI0023D99105|nr:hypothetical protein [Paraflavitalea sp. CAU 1676]MDF2187139.1 hypothetical protein [Paraflavitalea sp. CAU 1676]